MLPCPPIWRAAVSRAAGGSGPCRRQAKLTFFIGIFLPVGVTLLHNTIKIEFNQNETMQITVLAPLTA